MGSPAVSQPNVDNVNVFTGELLKEMTVDYERAASEDRLDEVRASTKTTLTIVPCRATCGP